MHAVDTQQCFVALDEYAVGLRVLIMIHLRKNLPAYQVSVYMIGTRVAGKLRGLSGLWDIYGDRCLLSAAPAVEVYMGFAQPARLAVLMKRKIAENLRRRWEAWI